MTDLPPLYVAGRRRSPGTMPGYHAGRPPRNKGMQYPADPPTVDEIVAVMRRTPTPSRAAAGGHRALARGPARPGNARIDRAMHRPAPRLAARAPRQVWAPPRGRD